MSFWSPVVPWGRRETDAPRENSIEKAIVAHAEDIGWLVWKVQIIGVNGCPDRFFARDGRVLFIEIKRPGEEPGKQQLLRRDELVKAGVEWHWVTNLEDAYVILA